MKKMRNIMLALVMTVLCSMPLVQKVLAEELPSVIIPAQINLSGTLPDPAEDYVVRIEAGDKANTPMPDGAEEGIYSMTITGEGSKDFPTITYPRVGIYTYTIYQIPGTNEKCTYDDLTYDLTVYVTNAEKGSGLEAVAVLYPDTQGNKQSAAAFYNEYETEPVTEPTTEPVTEPATEPVTEPITEPASTDAPKTGDESAAGIYLTLAAFSLLSLIILSPKNRMTGKDSK